MAFFKELCENYNTILIQLIEAKQKVHYLNRIFNKMHYLARSPYLNYLSTLDASKNLQCLKQHVRRADNSRLKYPNKTSVIQFDTPKSVHWPGGGSHQIKLLSLRIETHLATVYSLYKFKQKFHSDAFLP